jgi:aryl carrier-like protein
VLKAVIVADETCREADILGHCRAHLAAFKVPRFIEFRQALPRSPLGKLLRPELMDTAGWLDDVPSARDVAPGSRWQQIDWLAGRIVDQVAAIMACAPGQIARSVPFQDLGFDSLHAVELQERLSRMSGVALSITTLWNHPSIDDYAAFLLTAMQGSAGQDPSDPLDDIPDDEIAQLLARELDPTPEDHS